MQQPRLHGKVAIVTGAAMGLGEAIARRFAEEGARVACVDVRPGPNDTVVDAIRADGGEALSLEASVAADVLQIDRVSGVALRCQRDSELLLRQYPVAEQDR